MRIGLVTCELSPEPDADFGYLAPALRRRGVTVDAPAWNDPAIDWSAYDVAMISSTRDYHEQPVDFRSWVRRAAAATRLVNDPALVEWNIDKRYLIELEAAGVPTVPTVWIEPGGEAEAASEVAAAGWEQVVIKPVVDLGALNLVRVPAGLVEEMLGRYEVATMAQPYLPSVASAGELGLVFVDGELCHSLRRLPARGDFRVQSIYGGTHRGEEPSRSIREIAAASIAVAPVAPVYARVDIVGTDDGPAVIGLELIEPALYLDADPRTAERLADALLALRDQQRLRG